MSNYYFFMKEYCVTFFKKYFWFVAVLIPVLLLSMRCLPYEPRIWMDEGMYLQIARNIVMSGHYGLQVAPGVYAPTTVITTGPAALLVNAAMMKLSGISIYAARLGQVAYLLLFAAALFILLKRYAGLRNAVLGMLLVIVFNPLYSNGKVVSGEVPAMFWSVLGLIALWNIEQNKQSNRNYFLAGLWFGLAATTKTIFLLMPIAAGLAAFLFYKKINLSWRRFGLALLGFIGALIFWGIFQLGSITELGRVIQHNINVYGGVEKTSDLLQQNIRLFKKFDSPLYFLTLLLATGGIMFGRWRKHVLTITELAIGFYSILIFLNFLRLDPWYRYFFPAEVLLIAIFPFELWWLARHCQERVANQLLKSMIALSAGIVVMGLFVFHTAVLYKKQINACDANGTEILKTEMNNLARQSDSIYFLNTPDPAFFMPRNNYYQYLEITRVIAIGREALNDIKSGVAHFVVTRKDFLSHDAQYLGRYSRHKDIGNFLIWKKL